MENTSLKTRPDAPASAMTKRERLAMAALQARASHPEWVRETPEELAEEAVELADALIRELNNS